MIILPFDSENATLAAAGGKGANLAELTRAGFDVPPGYLITTDAYRAFVEENGIRDELLRLAHTVVPDDLVALEQASDALRALFTQAPIPPGIAAEIRSAYAALGAPAVAVRSSATAEDLPGVSFAGQQETYLNIVGAEAVCEAVKKCWGSLWTARAIGYRARQQIPPDDLALAVVVQQMIASEASGVLFTANPVTGNRCEIILDASFGLGEAIVSGEVEPDHFVWIRVPGRSQRASSAAKRSPLSPGRKVERPRWRWRAAACRHCRIAKLLRCPKSRSGWQNTIARPRISNVPGPTADCICCRRAPSRPFTRFPR